MPGNTVRRSRRRPAAKARLQQLLRSARAQGVKPVKDFEKFVNDVGDVWPKDENIDDFVSWLRKARREGSY